MPKESNNLEKWLIDDLLAENGLTHCLTDLMTYNNDENVVRVMIY